MRIEKSAGAIIFYETSNHQREYLLLHYPGFGKKAKDYWDFPKGHIEEGEAEIETVKREVFEETGLKDIEIIPGFKTSIKYFFQKEGKKIFKIVIFYLAKASSKEVKISFEHIGYTWLPFQQAYDLVTYKNAKEVLEKAHKFLEDFYEKKNI